MIWSCGPNQATNAAAAKGREAGTARWRRTDEFLGEQVLEIERVRAHVQLTVQMRPLGARTIAINLDAVAVHVGEVERLADTVVRGALHHRLGLDEATERSREIGARRHEDGEVIEAGGAAHARRRLALREHEKIRTAGAKPGGPSLAAMDREAEMRLVEPDRTIQIGNRQMDRADVRGRIDHSPLS